MHYLRIIIVLLPRGVAYRTCSRTETCKWNSRGRHRGTWRGSRRRLLRLGGRDNSKELLQYPINISFRQRHCNVRISVLTAMIDGPFHGDSVQFTSGTCVSSGIFIGVNRSCVSFWHMLSYFGRRQRLPQMQSSQGSVPALAAIRQVQSVCN